MHFLTVVIVLVHAGDKRKGNLFECDCGVAAAFTSILVPPCLGRSLGGDIHKGVGAWSAVGRTGSAGGEHEAKVGRVCGGLKLIWGMDRASSGS